MAEGNNSNILWADRLRHLGLPISFTKYSLDETRLFRQTGLFNLKEEELLLYRVRDLTLTRSLWQRIFGVGTITVTSSDRTTPSLEIKNIKKSKDIKELIHSKVDEATRMKSRRTTEILDTGEEIADENELS